MFTNIIKHGLRKTPFTSSFSQMKVKSHTVGNPYLNPINITTG